MSPFYAFSMMGMLGSKDRLAFGLAAELQLSPTLSRGGDGSPFARLK
jgi:hypothetical protein